MGPEESNQGEKSTSCSLIIPVSYFSHYVKFAKEDGQGLTGGHLSLLFQASEGGKMWKEMSPCFLQRGWSSPSFLQGSRSLLPCLASRLPGRFRKRRVWKNTPGELADFHSPRFIKWSLLLFTSTFFFIIHFQAVILFIIFSHNTEPLYQGNFSYTRWPLF